VSASRQGSVGYTARIVPIAVLSFDFDPLVHLIGDLVVRWETLAIAAVIAACLVLAGLLARNRALRADDLLYIAVGAVPGAIIGGRIGYGLVHWDVFGSTPLRLVDPGTAGLDLAAGVVGGILAGAYVASLLGSSVGRWAHLAAFPLLIALGAGKLAMVLGGSGQGLPSTQPWATAFLGPGPWGSLAPAIPSDPSQAYEGIATLAWAVVLLLIVWTGSLGRPDGRLLLLAVAGWAFLRAAVSLTWRDPVALGPFGPAGVLSIAIGLGSIVALLAMVSRARQASGDPTVPASAAPDWPDPGTRPPF
jgi:prolipoprotein diacylglyceryltransferase